jgi:hypothetical protein
VWIMAYSVFLTCCLFGLVGFALYMLGVIE